MSTTNKKFFSLECAVQNYHWGKLGEQSTVASLGRMQKNFNFDAEKHYAELWMGDHHRGPSIVQNMSEPTTLTQLLQNNPSLVGENIIKRFGKANLPFLFKVLSVETALSIQAHPNKEHAEILNRTRPDVYQDDNHKPEIAIAITPFEALCGFRPASEILSYFHEVEELLFVVGQKAVDELINAEMATDKKAKDEAVRRAIKGCLSQLMACDPNIIKEQLAKLVTRLNECHKKHEDTSLYLGRLLLRVHSQYLGDVGCFVIYFLNYIQLEPFESIFLGPDVPHAYIYGDIIECMANSDNVVRAGFTPKFKDVDTLIEMLDYKPQTVEETKFKPTSCSDDPHVSIYNPPIDDFSVKKIQIPAGNTFEYDVQSVKGPSILLTLSGHADVQYESEAGCLATSRGSVFFVGNGEKVKLTNISSNEELLMFQAYCDLV